MAFDISDELGDLADSIDKQVSDHMDGQPFSIVCSVCNSDLSFERTVDSDRDLELKVEPCDKCLENAREAEDG